MLTRYSSSFLAAAVLAIPLTLAGCNSGSDTTTNASAPRSNTGSTAGAAAQNTADRAGAAADNAANRAGTSAQNAGTSANNAAQNAGNAANNATSSVPGMPSVNGTNTNNLSTADAAAQRLIDNAQNNLKQHDTNKAKALVAELKEGGMYNSLSAAMKSKVDQLEKDVNAAPAQGTAQENK